ncbi:MAG: hypothetical protein V1729_04675 [Candidatus Woesearchaeota archaeon]
MKSLAKVVAIAALSIFSAGGARPAPKSTTVYHNQDRCGRAITEYDHHVMFPLTYAKGDIDGDRKPEHLYANWHRVDQFKEGDYGSIYDKNIYDNGSAERSTCVDLRLKDLDDDGDLDLVYLTSREVVVFKNDHGKLEMENDISIYLDDTKPPRLKFPRKNGQTVVEIVE